MNDWRNDVMNQYTECPCCGEMSFNEYKGICRNEECCYEDEETMEED